MEKSTIIKSSRICNTNQAHYNRWLFYCQWINAFHHSCT